MSTEFGHFSQPIQVELLNDGRLAKPLGRRDCPAPPTTRERAEAIQRKLHEIDVEALSDMRREAKAAVQPPRPYRGGFERNRSRH